jgi:hypothetical protein
MGYREAHTGYLQCVMTSTSPVTADWVCPNSRLDQVPEKRTLMPMSGRNDVRGRG